MSRSQTLECFLHQLTTTEEPLTKLPPFQAISGGQIIPGVTHRDSGLMRQHQEPKCRATQRLS